MKSRFGPGAFQGLSSSIAFGCVSDQNATDTLMQELFGSDDESEDNAHPQSTATERDNITKRPRSESPVSSPPPREPVEMPIDADAAAHAKHQEILTALERLMRHRR